ncbi:MAG: MarR family transcriptional regulator [Chloroflexota bacterium]|nr:MarR family transcriptional regulator [Chloroflexota bacterium]
MPPIEDARTPLDELVTAERDIVKRLDELQLDVDLEAMGVVSNIYRAASAIRRHMEQAVLVEARLSWTGFVALWVLWMWGEMEARHLAAEANVSKGTLTGVLDTLEARGLAARRRHTDDRRQVSVALTAEGEHLIAVLFPRFNEEETRIAALMTAGQRQAVTAGLRRIVRDLPDPED